MAVRHFVLAVVIPALAAAIPCVQFDTSWNLYAFGGASDVNLGQNTTWSSPSVTTLTSTGRPPWTGNYSQCLLSQSSNAMYVLGGDASDLSTIYVYNFAAGTWSTQKTSSAPPSVGNSRSSAVLDHDTNVIFTVPGAGQSMYQLDLSSITNTASGSALAWELVENPPFSTTDYAITAAQASNHINFFGVPGTTAGDAYIFVVHFAYFQPEVQGYPTINGGETFPDTGGQAISIPSAANNVPYQMVFFPNDFSNSYVVTHWTDPADYSITSSAPMSTNLINSTQILPAPGSQDPQASYAASDTALVQIDSTGNIYYMLSAVQNDYIVSSSPSWKQMSYSLQGTNATTSISSSSSGSASMTGSSSSTSTTLSGSISGSASETKTSSSASTSASASSSGSSVLVPTKRSIILGLTLVLVALTAIVTFLQI